MQSVPDVKVPTASGNSRATRRARARARSEWGDRPKAVTVPPAATAGWPRSVPVERANFLVIVLGVGTHLVIVSLPE